MRRAEVKEAAYGHKAPAATSEQPKLSSTGGDSCHFSFLLTAQQHVIIIHINLKDVCTRFNISGI